jgi:hypothetical protein
MKVAFHVKVGVSGQGRINTNLGLAATPTETSAKFLFFGFCHLKRNGPPNAIHHGEGLRRLDPGQTEIAICTLDGSLNALPSW